MALSHWQVLLLCFRLPKLLPQVAMEVAVVFAQVAEAVREHVAVSVRVVAVVAAHVVVFVRVAVVVAEPAVAEAINPVLVAMA